MKIFNAAQIKAWDQFTIKHEPIASVDLMERAAQQCVSWIEGQDFKEPFYKIFCGKGNNGGDGLAIARLLIQSGKKAAVYILEFGKMGTEDFQTNLQRLHELTTDIHFIQFAEHFPSFSDHDVILDALYGAGLNKPLDGLSAELVQHINAASKMVISIDLPSGMFMDQSSVGNVSVKANYTLTFQSPKLALLVAENAGYFGEVHILDIGLHQQFLNEENSDKTLIDTHYINSIFQKRNGFAHKGTFGHSLIIGGSYGKIGAITLTAKSCLKSGAGLVTSYIPGCGYNILQVAVPEVMTLTGKEDELITDISVDANKYNAIGIGPGIGTDERTQDAIIALLKNCSKQ